MQTLQCTARRLTIATLIGLGGYGSAQAQESTDDEITTEVAEALDFEDDLLLEDDSGFVPDEGLEQYLSVSSKLTQTVEEAPASVYVITKQEIQNAGYASVGEALSFVPGLFTSYDLVNYHVGVRGIFGGSRSGSRTLKVLIDGRPITVVQSGTYLLGNEFIPMSAIERIEVMRGPASALYGAGALEGAINVVTKRPPFEGETTFGGQAFVSGGVLGQLGGGVDATAMAVSENALWMLSYSGSRTDRSGLTIPENSSEFSSHERFMDNGRMLSSRNDIAKPQVFLGKVQATVGDGRLDGRVMMQMTDSGAEFHDLTVLSGGSRVRFYNANAALSYEKPFASGLSLRTSLGFTKGAPLTGDRFLTTTSSIPVGLVSLGDNVAYERDFSSEEFTGSVELLREFSERGLLTVGVDAAHDVENLSSVTEVDPVSGMAVSTRPSPGEVTLSNFAGYAQVLYPVGGGLSLAGGARYDYITDPSGSGVEASSGSSTNGALTGRLAAVYSPVERVSLKAMLGRAYKVASPEQRFARAIRPGDFAGKVNLPPQFINSAELSASAFVARTFKVTATGFFNQHQDALSNILSSGSLVAASFNSETFGGEVSAHYSSHFESGTVLEISSALSLQDTKTERSIVDGLPIKPVPDNEIFPRFMLFTKANFRIPEAKMSVFAAYRHIGERVPSQSNTAAASSVSLEAGEYRLDPFDVIDLGVSTLPISLGHNRDLTASIKVQNVLDNKYSEIGFNGVDVPTLGRVVWGRARLDF